jgi:hypothetical protein
MVSESIDRRFKKNSDFFFVDGVHCAVGAWKILLTARARCHI